MIEHEIRRTVTEADNVWSCGATCNPAAIHIEPSIAKAPSSGEVKVVPVATETPQAMLTMASYAHTPLPRLAGIAGGAEDLSAAIGAVSNRDEDGGPFCRCTNWRVRSA